MLDGTLDVDTQAARLAAKGTIDDVPADISLVEPIDSTSNQFPRVVHHERVMSEPVDPCACCRGGARRRQPYWGSGTHAEDLEAHVSHGFSSMVVSSR